MKDDCGFWVVFISMASDVKYISPKWLTPSFFNMHSWRHPGRAKMLYMLSKMIHMYTTNALSKTSVKTLFHFWQFSDPKIFSKFVFLMSNFIEDTLWSKSHLTKQLMGYFCFICQISVCQKCLESKLQD